MESKIEQIIGDIEDYIDKCKPHTFSANKIIVNKDEILYLLEELRNKAPKEIERYQKIISQKERILADAEEKADEIIAQAQAKNDKLTNEHQIMQRAYEEANKIILQAETEAEETLSQARSDARSILDSAITEANQFRMGAVQYTKETLKNLEAAIGRSLEETKSCHSSYLNTLQEFYDIVSSNRAELTPIGEEESFDLNLEEEEFSQDDYDEEQ